MAIEDALAGLIGDIVTPVVNSILKNLGYSEIESKKVQRICMWSIIALFCCLLIGLTLIYS